MSLIENADDISVSDTVQILYHEKLILKILTRKHDFIF